jgi:hypothetical protein
LLAVREVEEQAAVFADFRFEGPEGCVFWVTIELDAHFDI